eukprot:360786-Chlamydomonas_euryale.AAC.7
MSLRPSLSSFAWNAVSFFFCLFAVISWCLCESKLGCCKCVSERPQIILLSSLAHVPPPCAPPCLPPPFQVNMIKAQETQGFVGRPKRPRALVLGPTKELTEQIAGVAKVLAHSAKFRSLGLTGTRTRRQQAEQLAGPIDVVVATPTRFLQHAAEGNVFYK